MSNKRPLVLPFLNQLDHHLLINKPEVWSARTHLVAYYGGLFIAVLALLSFLIPNDPRSDSPAASWVVLVVMISLVALVVWLIYLLRFNVFKRYGNITPLSRLTTFGLYFVAVGTISLFPLVMPYIESIRANKAYGDQELVDDINAINVKICQLEYDSLPHNLKADTILVVNELPQYRSLPEADEVDTIAVTPLPYRPHRLVDTGSLSAQISVADSSARLNDSMWVLYESKEYMFVNAYMMRYDRDSGMYANFDLYKKVIRNFSLPDRRAIRMELYRLLNKYKPDVKRVESYEYDFEAQRNIYSRIRKRYDLYTLERSLSNIAQRKYRWREENAEFFIRSYYYTALIFTLLVFIYRHTTRKTFFLSMLAAIILTILTSLVGAYFTPKESSLYMWLMAYMVLFFVGSLFSFSTRVRYAVTGICINLFVLMVVSFPLCLAGYYYRTIIEDDRMLPDHDAMSRNMLYAELAGSLLLLILLATYIPKVYRKWYALPEE